MYCNNFTESDHEEVFQKIKNFQPYLFFKNLTFGLSLSFLFFNFSRITNCVLNIILNKPGVGKVEPITLKKNKIATIKTNVGDIRVPLVKMPSFDLSMGFFMEKVDLDPGLHFLEEFYEFPEHIKLKNFGTSWITDILKPMTLNGSGSAKGFIISYIDSTVYIFDVTDNNFIDYKKIINNYELALEDYDNSEIFEPEEQTNNEPEEQTNNEPEKEINIENDESKNCKIE